MNQNASTQVRPGGLAEAIEAVKAGARLLIPTAYRCTVIDAKCLARFEKAGQWLLKAEGEGFRLRNGKGSVYILPGQLILASGA